MDLCKYAAVEGSMAQPIPASALCSHCRHVILDVTYLSALITGVVGSSYENMVHYRLSNKKLIRK